jgi:hypothetical protein
MLNTADVRGYDALRARRCEVGELSIAQLAGQYGLQQRIGSRGSTTQVGLALCNPYIETEYRELRFDGTSQLLAML